MIENKGLSGSLSDFSRGFGTLGFCHRLRRRGGRLWPKAQRPLQASKHGAGSAQKLSTEVVDNVVGNRWRRPPKPRETLCLHALHKKSAPLLTMQIKHLRLRDSSVTGRVRRRALWRAAVEFQTRAVVGVSRD